MVVPSAPSILRSKEVILITLSKYSRSFYLREGGGKGGAREK